MKQVEAGTRVAIDFDGVLADPTTPVEEAYPGVRDFLRALWERGYEIVVLTARIDHAPVWDFLRGHHLDEFVAAVTNIKVPAIAYVDDRAIPHTGNFTATLARLDSFIPHWGGKPCRWEGLGWGPLPEEEEEECLT